MRTTIQNEAFTLLQQGEQPTPGLITETHLLGLPAVVQRYLRYTQIIGKEPIRTVHLKQQGSFRTKEGQLPGFPTPSSGRLSMHDQPEPPSIIAE